MLINLVTYLLMIQYFINNLHYTMLKMFIYEEIGKRALVFFLPNLILVNEMFSCQKWSQASFPAGMGPELSVKSPATF